MTRGGFLNLLKPPGMTSHDVVALVRRQLPRRTKVGHLGTLDPAAAGVLPVAVGRATKLIPLVPDLGPSMKSYLGHIQFGVFTGTDDLEGEIVWTAPPESLKTLTAQGVEKALNTILHRPTQVPPSVSALRQDGKRAYQLVRQGATVTLPPREVHIEELRLLAFDSATSLARVFMQCGSGTYVRSVARDAGEILGVGGALKFLLRTHSGCFHLDQSLSLEELLEQGVKKALLPPSLPFAHFPVYQGEPLLQKGRKVGGTFESEELHLAPDGLVRPSGPAEATVVALFGEVD